MKTCPQCHAMQPDGVLVCPNDDTALVEAKEWLSGAVINGKYRILAKFGQDVVSTLYTAGHLRGSKSFALNVLHRELAGTPEFVRLFKRGFREQKKLRHASIARIQGIEESNDGLPFVVMDYPEGRSLLEVIREEGPLAPLRACAIARKVAAGLHAAHEEGIIHRDLKPDYIIVSRGRGNEGIKVLGFCNSQLKEAVLKGQFRTSPDNIIGAVQYLSPEQALGRPSRKVDARSDIYSLGVILYEMVTKELPFSGTHAGDWMTAHIQGSPIPIRFAHADLAIPAPLITLVTSCLEKDPAHRPGSARDFIREVDFVEGEIKRLEKSRRRVAQTSGERKSPSWKFWKS